MARVLFAWEFGGDLGHARRLVPIARELRGLGHEPLFVFRDVALLGDLAREGFEWFAAPRLRQPAALDPTPLNASDILLNLGYGDAMGLNGALRAWLALVALVKPALMVADYAPTALLAARAAKIARITIGTGFSVPAHADPLPALREWHPVEPSVLQRFDARLVDIVVRAFDKLSLTAIAPRSAFDVFDADAHLLCTLPEIDPFGPREGVEYVGPQGDAQSGDEAAWRKGASPRVFAYLKPRDARFAPAIEALHALGGDAIVAAPGLDPAQAAAHCSATVRVFPNTLRLDTLLADADLCVSHGGPGLAARALVAGVPMALVPMQLEQYLVGMRLVRAGVAQMLAPDAPSADLRGWIAGAVADARMREAARKHAKVHAGYRFEEAPGRTARRIAAALG